MNKSAITVVARAVHFGGLHPCKKWKIDAGTAGATSHPCRACQEDSSFISPTIARPAKPIPVVTDRMRYFFHLRFVGVAAVCGELHHAMARVERDGTFHARFSANAFNKQGVVQRLPVSETQHVRSTAIFACASTSSREMRIGPSRLTIQTNNC